MNVDYEHFMQLALSEAKRSGDDVPVGAVIVAAVFLDGRCRFRKML